MVFDNIFLATHITITGSANPYLETTMREIFELHLVTFTISFSVLSVIVTFIFGDNLTWVTIGLIAIIALILSPFIKALLESFVKHK